jgi:peptidoglycan/LPS O-acetylase OafA/YrhL
MSDQNQDFMLEKGYWPSSLKAEGKPHVLSLVFLWVSDPVRRLKPLLNTITGLLPNKIRRRSTTPAPLTPTSYLDGLRGFAALMVYCLHHQTWAHESLGADNIIENAFGYNRQYYVAALPGIRTFFSGGHLAVAVFFVISGYVLSAKPLLLIQQNQMIKLGDNLSSALFRRWLRLYIPVIVTTFVWMLLIHSIHNLSVHRTEATLFDEVWKWYSELKEFSFVFRNGGDPWFTYNNHIWTIPLEFKGSILVYTTLMAFSRCTRNMRLCGTAGLAFYFLYICDGWYLASFAIGMLLCDLDLLAQDNQLPRVFERFAAYKDSISISAFVIGIYLGGVPSHSLDLNVLRDSPGWYYLSFLKPQAVYMTKQFYLFWASLLIVAAVPRISWLKSFFEMEFNQYLGRVSYAFYLVHGPVLWSIGDRVYAAIGWTKESHVITIANWINVFPLPKWGLFGMEFSFIAAQLVLLPITLWVARITTTLVDESSIRLSRWAYGYAIAAAPPCRDTPTLVT